MCWSELLSLARDQNEGIVANENVKRKEQILINIRHVVME